MNEGASAGRKARLALLLKKSECHLSNESWMKYNDRVRITDIIPCKRIVESAYLAVVKDSSVDTIAAIHYSDGGR